MLWQDVRSAGNFLVNTMVRMDFELAFLEERRRGVVPAGTLLRAHARGLDALVRRRRHAGRVAVGPQASLLQDRPVHLQLPLTPSAT
ncbi:MAG: hypothetical protein ACLUNV_02020 [Sutterella wadsworthensis]